MDAIVAYIKELAEKLWNLGKLLVPIYAIWQFITTLFSVLISSIKTWFLEKLTYFKNLVLEQTGLLQVDLNPPPAMLAFIAKMNTVIPLSEMWHYFLLYLGFASVIVGIKWTRNLIPGLK